MAPSDRDRPTTGRRQRSHAYVLAPRLLLAFPDAVRVRRKGRHGTLEVYDAFGRHLGEFDAVTGTRLKIAVAGRRIEP